jgi:hypothetical protein
MTRRETHDGAAVEARDRKQNENRAWNRTYPIGLSSTIDPVSPEAVLPFLHAALRLVVLRIAAII